MGFNALQKLNEEELTRVINDLVSGEPSTAIVRMIQEHWGNAQNVTRAVLENELKELRFSVMHCDHVPTTAGSATALNNTHTTPMDHIKWLIEFQQARVRYFLKQERRHGKTLPHLNRIIQVQLKSIVAWQKLLDRELAEYNKVKPTSQKQTKATMEAWEREQAKTNKQVFEAVETIQDIFKKRRLSENEKFQ